MPLARGRRGAAGACLLSAAVAAACTPGEAVDLLTVARTRVVEVDGRDAGGLGAGIGVLRRIGDVAHAALPATPPSRLVLEADVPRGGRLVLAAGIPHRYHRRPGVEFTVKVRRRGQETIVLSRLVDPMNRVEDRSWIELEADLSSHAGRGVQIVLETRGYEETGSVHAFWGTPVITTPDTGDAPLVVVYLVDTLRPDHLSLYGYERNTAPELERFAQDAVVFEEAIAPSPWTKPSVASLFTALRPGEHHCLHLEAPLDRSFVTLAESLQAGGYATGAVVANRIIHVEGAHFDQGFAFFAAPPAPERASEVVSRALEYLDARRGLPTFLYVHTMDPHSPYAPPPPFDRRFGPPPAPGRRAADPRYDYQETLDRDRMVAQYDGEIAYGDQEFGRFIRELKARGLHDRALIVFLSDHGEEFLDHGGWMHGRSVFEELVRVPLVVKFPGNRHAGRRVAHQVDLLGVLPTILKSQGLPVPQRPAAPGRPLDEAPGAEPGERFTLSEVNHRGYVIYGLRTRTKKYIRVLSPGEDELYFDLERDPREQVNRLPQGGPRLLAMRQRAEAALSPSGFRHRVRVEGEDAYDLEMRTSGWIEEVETEGLGPDEHARLEGGGRRLAVALRPRAGRAREISFRMRPHGAPVWLEGARAGRPLRPRDIRVGSSGRPSEVPYRLPQRVVSRPPGGVPGIGVWVEPVRPGDVVRYDDDDRERLRALGYVE